MNELTENTKLKGLASLPTFLTDLLDGGEVLQKPVYYLYYLIAAVFVIFPFYAAYEGIAGGLFEMPFKTVIGAFLAWIVMLATCAIVACLWFGRKGDILMIETEAKSFPATHLFAHFLQVTGESIALICFVSGTLLSVFAYIFAGEFLSIFMDLGFLGWKGVLGSIILGIILLLFSRFASEQFKALATIAKNSGKTSSID